MSKEEWWMKPRRIAAEPTPEQKEWKLVENENQRAAFRAQLLAELDAEDPFPHSSKEKNADVDQKGNPLLKKYEEVLPGYELSPEKRRVDKMDFWRPGDPNTGHKVHLDVPISGARAVSTYLTKSGYAHKYLSGGEDQQGKIFTLYLGSRDNALKQAEIISRSLEEYLRRPRVMNEIEYAPNVVGRFHDSHMSFSQYGLGLRGLPMLSEDTKRLPWEVITEGQKADKKFLREAFERSYKALADKYGIYFYGSG